MTIKNKTKILQHLPKEIVPENILLAEWIIGNKSTI